MRFNILYLILFSVLNVLLAKNANAQRSKERKLVWSDEFNYTGLPDAKKWNYEHGYIRNNEEQYYSYARKENAYVHDEMLEIKGIKGSFPNEFYEKGSK